MSLCQGGSFASGLVSGALGSFGASAWGAMVGDKLAKSAVGTIAFGALSGGVGAELTDGNFWQGVLIGGMVAGLNHTMHMAMDGDPPGKKKGLGQKIKENPDKVTEVADAYVATKKISMLSELRKTDNIGRLAHRYAKFTKAGRWLGRVNNVATAYNTYSDLNDYSNGDLSGARLSYKLGSTLTSLGTSSVVGTEFGGPWGTVAGFAVGTVSSVGEMIYDSWNNTIMPMINQGVYQINNNHAYSNFHP